MTDENTIGGLFGEAAPETPPQIAPEPVEQPSAEAAPAPETDDDAEPPAATPGQPTVPRSALEDERRKRKDWKEQFTRADEQLRAATQRQIELEAQLAEARKAPPPVAAEQQVPQPQAIPSPIEDPQGYDRVVQDRIWDAQLNMSEAMFAQANPDVNTKELAAKFAAIAKDNPMLQRQLRAAPHPYLFAAQQVKRSEALAKIGEDPDAWIEAEIARRAETQKVVPAPLASVSAAPPKPAPALPPSLATARSATPSAAPTADNDLLKAALPGR